MGYCSVCEIYYNKLPYKDLCRQCSNELCGTPPSINNNMKQYETFIQKKKETEHHQKKYKDKASLMDLTADTLIINITLLITLSNILPDGNPPWYALLHAWYRHIKKRGRRIKTEEYPMVRLFRLMNIRAE